MKTAESKINYYFGDIENFAHKELFDGVEHAYQVLDRIRPYVNKYVEGRESNIVIGENVKIHPTAVIKGPVIIGKNCEIDAHAYVRPYTILGDDVMVGHGTEIKASILFNRAKASSLTFVGDSILGKSVRIGSGAITANRSFSQDNIILKTTEDKIDTGRDFFGCIIGDNTRIGCNSVIAPGSHIGGYTWIYPLTNISGFIPEAKRVYHEKPLTMRDNERKELAFKKGY